MVEIKKISTKTGISDLALVNGSRSTLKSATRDLVKLAPFGVTTELLASWTVKIDAFENVKKIEAQRGDKNSIFNERDSKAYEVKIATKRLKGQLMFVYSEETNEYSSIFSTKLAKINANNLLKLGQSIVEVLNKPNDNLLMYGVTAERIAEYTALINELASLVEECYHADATFSILTQERSELKSEVFKMYKFVCRIGKEVWTNRNNGYYKSYKVHKPSSPPITEITGSVSTTPEVETPTYS